MMHGLLVEYFLSQDDSGHWYVAQEQHRAKWDRWSELDEDDPAGWETPEFAERLDGGPSRVIFTNYRLRGD